MHAIKIFLVPLVLCIAAHFLTGVVQAAPAEVVRIDGNSYSADDLRHWWQNWREPEMAVPATPDPYIDWQLMAREAERMAFFDDPGYQREVRVYLEVVSLVNLKNEAIDTKIDYSEEKLWAYYQEQFSPQWLLNILLFQDQDSAEKTIADLKAGKVTVDELAQVVGARATSDQAKGAHGGAAIDVEALKKVAGAGEKLLGVQEKVVKRPISLEKSWREAVANLDKGAYSKPLAWQEAFVVLHVLDKAPGTKEDFAKKQGEVRTRYRKYWEAVLTNRLVEDLKKKFAVKVDEERIATLDPARPPAEFGETPVITFSTMTVSERQLMEKVAQDMAFNKQYGFKPEDHAALVKRVAEGVVSQTLITQESLDRHYEQKSPTRELMEFYKKQKLVTRLEEHIRSQGTTVTEQEKQEYYQQHLADFTTPQVYRMAVIEGAEEVLKKIWLEVTVNGKDIVPVTEERLGHKPQVVSYPSNHLSPEVKARAAALNKGDLSQVFSSGEGFAMLYMEESIPSRTTKYEQIDEMIGKKLVQERFVAAKETYLKALREKAKISVNEPAWATLREELDKENEKKEHESHH